jgi:hypothetical protein
MEVETVAINQTASDAVMSIVINNGGGPVKDTVRGSVADLVG